MLDFQIKTFRISIAALIMSSVSLHAQLPPPPKTNAIVIGGGDVKFPNSSVKDKNDKKVSALEQNFQRELMQLRKAERKKVSPEARQKAQQAYANLNIQMGSYVNNVRDAAKEDLNAYNRLNFGASANRYMTTNEMRGSNGYLNKSGNPYADIANDMITEQIKRILASNPTKKFTITQILARIVFQINVSMKPENRELFYNQLGVLDLHLQQLVDSGYAKKETTTIAEAYLDDETIIIRKYLGFTYSIK